MTEIPFAIQLVIAGFAGFAIGFCAGWIVESVRLRWIDRHQPPPF